VSEPYAACGTSLTEVLNGARIIGERPPRVTSCTDNWALVRPGDAYVAVTQADRDGHDWVNQAVERGAAVIICERQLPVFQVSQLVVDDSTTA
jgi:UDP-N-acetylmuramyl pentapeptide synthase